ncbi:hypothetical protein [Homoserinimonas sp. OAct 916]|uniref:hypothetical protein n=1 Tax=Homoserinimonas sp. OAct 916 TaxID=2211450 RepID=UPI0013009D3F|nr:hypothetical protein [Homoserinimonas sp. OAct 916]
MDTPSIDASLVAAPGTTGFFAAVFFAAAFFVPDFFVAVVFVADFFAAGFTAGFVAGFIAAGLVPASAASAADDCAVARSAVDDSAPDADSWSDTVSTSSAEIECSSTTDLAWSVFFAVGLRTAVRRAAVAADGSVAGFGVVVARAAGFLAAGFLAAGFRVAGLRPSGFCTAWRFAPVSADASCASPPAVGFSATSFEENTIAAVPARSSGDRAAEPSVFSADSLGSVLEVTAPKYQVQPATVCHLRVCDAFGRSRTAGFRLTGTQLCGIQHMKRSLQAKLHEIRRFCHGANSR